MVKYLIRLFQVSLNNSKVPSDWKKATIVSIFKSGNRTNLHNYRPVSLTSVICKQMEKLIAEYMTRVWGESKWLYGGQHGFRSGYSCESQITTLCQDIADIVDRGGRVDAVFIDFSKAFDLVPHDLLLFKLKTSGLDKRVLAWLKDFLSHRTQKVKIGNSFSNEGKITSGVPQGSVVGPLLFLAFINDLCINIKSNLRLFADDCVVYREIVINSDINELQEDLNSISKWVEINKMKINMEKSNVVSFNRNRNREPLHYAINSCKIPEKLSCKYLGVILRQDLGWGDQVTYTTRKAWKSLHFVMRNLKKSSSAARKIAYQSLVRPMLEYASACWDPYRKGQIISLERVQKKAIKFINRYNNSVNSVTMMSLENRRKVHRLVNLFKALKNEPAWGDIHSMLKNPT